MIITEEFIKFKIKRNKASAKSRGYKYSLTKQNMRNLMAENYCQYSGHPFADDEKHSFHLTLERIDNSKGYVPGNVIPVCQLANKIKSNLNTIDDLVGERARIATKVENRKIHIKNDKNAYAKRLNSLSKLESEFPKFPDFTKHDEEVEKTNTTLKNLINNVKDHRKHLEYDMLKLDMIDKTINTLTMKQDLGYKYLTRPQKVWRKLTNWIRR
jgi:hypothetical protein